MVVIDRPGDEVPEAMILDLDEVGVILRPVGLHEEPTEESLRARYVAVAFDERGQPDF